MTNRKNQLLPLTLRSTQLLRATLVVAGMTAAMFVAFPSFAQTLNSSADASASESSAAAVPANVVPRLIKYSGVLLDGRGYPITVAVDVTFALYSQQNPDSKAALWQETQHVSPNEKGAYSIYLGAASAHGLAAEVFTAVSAQWLGIKVEDEPEQARVLLASVPYAFKAGDAQTLGGLPASAFVLAGSQLAATMSAAAVSPDAGSTVTTTGGTYGYVPQFTGASTVANSQIFVSSAGVGINKTSPAATLDVNGDMIVRGSTIVARTGNATASQGYPSNEFAFYANAYNSSTKVATNPHFQMQSEPVGNNTATPSATFNVLYANGGTPAETGFYINPNGTIHFAPSQTFPGGGGGITQITAGTDLTGGGSSGNVTLNLDTTKVPTLSSANIFSGLQRVVGTGIYGLYATGDFNGLDGNSSGTDPNGSGVYGTGPTGVFGVGSNIGVFGYSSQAYPATSTGAGIFAQIGTASNELTSLENIQNLIAGLITDGGQGDHPSGQSEIGLVATADNSSAGVFFNDSAAFETLSVENDADGGPLFEAYTPGDFAPDCSIDGSADLQCSGYIAGSNVNPFTKRTVLTYGMQSAEHWYEDAGSGQLQNGAAHIDLETTYSSLVNTSVDYHVFLTPKGDCKGLYVTNETATGFEVHELGGGGTSITFDYRIMAKRKGYEKIRLEDKTEERRQQVARRLKRHPGLAIKHNVMQARVANAK